MRNRFTITISDVHGARHYSFAQMVKRFAFALFSMVFILVVLALLTLWVTLGQKQKIEEKHAFAVELYADRLYELQAKYDAALAEKSEVEQVLDEKNKQVDQLDLKLQGLEELVMGSEGLVSSETPESVASLESRLLTLQASTLAKQYLLEMIPSGSAVASFQGFSSLYGMRLHPVLGRKKMHYGIDYRGEKGVDVIATAEGVVMFASTSSVGFGKMITLSHASGFKSRYGHLSKMLVKPGEFVVKGQKIGEIGNTGRSTAPHLHYEVMFLSTRLNPQPFHEWSFNNFNQIFTEVKQVPWASFVDSANLKIEQAEKQLLPEVASLVEKSLN